MSADTPLPSDALARIFHEPNRLAIVSAVCAADRGIAFTALRDACGLTDGNLNRHLKVLEEAGVIRVDKAFVDDRPRTTLRLTKKGFSRFSDYLAALGAVLERARAALPAARPMANAAAWAKPVRA